MSTKKKNQDASGKRKKVSRACLFCRRSHMTCTESRPCERCVKRDIAHLCTDEQPGPSRKASEPQEDTSAQQSEAHSSTPPSGVEKATTTKEIVLPPMPSISLDNTSVASSSQVNPSTSESKTQSSVSNPFALLNQAYDFSYPSNNNASLSSLASLRLFATTADAQFGSTSNLGKRKLLTDETAAIGDMYAKRDRDGSDAGTGSDIDSNALDDFLRSLDEIYLNPLLPEAPAASSQLANDSLLEESTSPRIGISASSLLQDTGPPSRPMSPFNGQLRRVAGGTGTATPSSSTERFLLTAADQKDGTRDERLNKVIRAKYEAGLLKPFNYIKGYERLNTWMDNKWSSNSKRRTLKIISEFRPAFRAIAQSLTDMDLIYIEEAFERLLLDYDRVFSTMGIPACLWRRTGEIFKGNKEFAELVGVSHDSLREGKLSISELMAEDSAVNFWEKYGSIAFDPGQKAVLTSCILVNQSVLRGDEERKKSRLRRQSSNSVTSAFDKEDFLTPAASYPPNVPKEALIMCTFSFTIRRDAYHIPTAIVGNFMELPP